jgi:hypothetical protein
VFSGPDHLSAIAPIACVEQRRVWIVGLRWGLGHSLGVVIIGLLAGVMAHWVRMVSRHHAFGDRNLGLVAAVADATHRHQTIHHRP